MRTGLRRLWYFIKLSEQLNFRRAASDLGMTQPALTRAIARLEDDVGFRLLDRTKRHVDLTEAGRLFCDGCREALAVLERAEARSLKVAKGQAGGLCIGYTDIAISGVLADIVQSFSHCEPDIVVDLRQSFSDAQKLLLAAGEIDVGFMTEPVPQADFASFPVQIDRFVVVLPPRHRLTGKRSVRLCDLADEPFVLGSEEKWRAYHALLYAACRDAGFEPRVVQRAPDTQGIFGLVACGMGVSVQTERSLVDSRVEVLPLRDCDRVVTTSAVWLRETRRLVVQRFVGHIRRVRDAEGAQALR